MIVADTSVLLPAVLSNHEFHDACHDAITLTDAAVAHTLFELYATLTRLPAPLKMSADAAASVVRGYSTTVIAPDVDQVPRLVDRFGDHRVLGGATYDALIAATALAHDATLLTRDHRALTTYERFGTDIRFVAT